MANKEKETLADSSKKRIISKCCNSLLSTTRPNNQPQPPQPQQPQDHKAIVPASQIPQLTELGERLAQDKERTYLESLLEGLSEKADEKTNQKTNEATNSSEVHAPLPLAKKPGSDTREEAIKSARHILQTVWSMQHIDKLQPPPSPLPPSPLPPTP